MGGVLNSRASAKRRSCSGNGGKSFQFLGIHDGEIEPGFRAVVEEDRIDDFTGTRGQTEGDVGDAEDGFDVAGCALDEADCFDGFNCAADVVFITRRAREDQRIDDDVFGRNAVFCR